MSIWEGLHYCNLDYTNASLCWSIIVLMSKSFANLIGCSTWCSRIQKLQTTFISHPGLLMDKMYPIEVWVSFPEQQPIPQWHSEDDRHLQVPILLPWLKTAIQPPLCWLLILVHQGDLNLWGGICRMACELWMALKYQDISPSVSHPTPSTKSAPPTLSIHSLFLNSAQGLA